MAPRKVFLHVGLHKTGTTYLQNTMRVNRENLRRQGVEYPGGPGEPVQSLAVWDVQGRRPRGTADDRIAGMWNALVRHVATTERPTVLISEERLSVSTVRQAKRVLEAFSDYEVHVIVTARDIARIAVSAWQEAIKNDSRITWSDFSTAIKTPELEAKNPARSFWLRQDLVRICETWEAAGAHGRMHLVTVPASGSSPDALIERYSSVVGFDPAALTEEPAWNNESVGVSGIEVIRQVNERMGGRLNQRQYDRVIKHTLVPLMARHTTPARFAMPAEDIEWAQEHARRTISSLGERDYDVVGSLEDLVPVSRAGNRRPDDATGDEIREAAVDALALLAESYATSWWARRKPDQSIADGREAVASKTRALVFRAQRKAGEIADRNVVAHKALGIVLRARDKARTKALDSRD